MSFAQLPSQVNPTVERWRPYAAIASKKWGIPIGVLLADIEEESGGNTDETSSTGAKGLTQFEPATAAKYGVNTGPGGELSQIEGQAHYLHDLGFAKNPVQALASYNAGPGNWEAGIGYAESVLEKAKAYGANTTTTAPATPNTTTTSTKSNPLLPAGHGSGEALKDLSYVLLFAIGAGLLYMGITRAAGRNQGAIG
jgi:hypothetical protein